MDVQKETHNLDQFDLLYAGSEISITQLHGFFPNILFHRRVIGERKLD